MSTELRLFFSPCRLASYQLPGEEWPVALARYQWNLQLAEAMLPSLNYLEVGLRNGVNRLVGGIYSPDWLITLPIQIQFSEDDLSQIARIKADVLKYKGKLASHDDVLAQLNFGFWVALFHKRHMGGIWSRAREPLASTFPHMPASYWGGEELRERRQQVKNLLDSVKALRNRIAHHEPIWKQTPTALDVHQNCIDLIRALSPAAADELAKIDRFASIYSAGPSKVSS